MESYKRVTVTQDDDGHWYIIPFELTEEFEEACERGDDNLINEKFWQYTTGGALSLVELYIKEE
jgi:hypothetical protein